jgi:hypothetical protein
MTRSFGVIPCGVLAVERADPPGARVGQTTRHPATTLPTEAASICELMLIWLLPLKQDLVITRAGKDTDLRRYQGTLRAGAAGERRPK